MAVRTTRAEEERSRAKKKKEKASRLLGLGPARHRSHRRTVEKEERGITNGRGCSCLPSFGLKDDLNPPAKPFPYHRRRRRLAQMQILRPILRLLRHPNLAASPAPMHHLSSPLRFFMESATNRWWPPALARRVSPLMMSPIPPAANRVFRQPRNMATISRVGGYGSGSDEDGSGSDALEDHELGIIVSDGEELFAYSVLEDSRHRDGSIYTAGMDIWWKQEYSIVDRNETRLQEMPLSYPCVIYDGTCLQHVPRHMLQIVSLKLSKIPVDGGLVQLYGYIAVRDCLDPLLNYVVNISRDEPIILEKGSLINMAGPKRGIDLISLVLIEYDMRIKAGEQEKDDLQLIDGVSIIGNAGDWNYPPFTIRIAGDCGGAVDLTVTRIDDAFEATVQVFISEVQCSFNLSLGCLTSGLNKEIWLFDGAIAESCSLKTSVVAVAMDCLIDLKFKLGSSSDQHCCSFESKTHGHDTQEIKTDFALISVKVSWSALP